MSHSLTLVLFSRSYAPKRGGGSAAPQGLMRDAAGRTYTDHYKLVVENESRSEWEPLLAQLKRHFQVSLTLTLTLALTLTYIQL